MEELWLQIKEYLVALWNETSPAIIRFLRSSTSLVIGILVANATGHWWGVFVAPIINAISKYLRDTYGWDWFPA